LESKVVHIRATTGGQYFLDFFHFHIFGSRPYPTCVFATAVSFWLYVWQHFSFAFLGFFLVSFSKILILKIWYLYTYIIFYKLAVSVCQLNAYVKPHICMNFHPDRSHGLMIISDCFWLWPISTKNQIDTKNEFIYIGRLITLTY